MKKRTPNGDLLVVVYTLVLIGLGGFLIAYPRQFDSGWPLLMVPVLVASLYYPRRIYALMLTSYTCVSFWVILVSAKDKIESSSLTIFFLLSVGIASEVLYRLTAARERAKQALHDSESKFHSLSDTAPIGIFQTDPEGRCTYVNPYCRAITGLTLEDSLGFGWQSNMHPDDRRAMLANWGSTPENDQTFSREFRIITPDGEERWLHATSTAVGSLEGKVLGRVGTIQDITDRKCSEEALQRAKDELETQVEQRTAELVHAIHKLKQEIVERKQAEEALYESREHLRTVVDNAIIMIISFDRNGMITLSQGKSLDVMGHQSSKLVGKSIHELQDHQPDIMEHCRRALDGECFGYVSESQGRAFQAHFSPLRDQTGDLVGGMAVFIDITERVKAELALRESESKLRAAADGSLDAFFIFQSVRDEDGRIIDFDILDLNPRAERIVSRTRDEVVGKRLSETFPISRKSGLIQKYIRVAETGQTLDEDFSFEMPDKGEMWFHHQVIPLDNGVAVSSRNITDRKVAERQLQDYANSQTLLLNQLMTAQEAERRRLSMDIHDGPLQSLGVGLMALDRAIRRRERGEQELEAEELHYLRETLQSTVSEVRAVLADLSLELLGNYGLDAALRNHIERFCDLTGIPVNLQNNVQADLPPDIELLMYRLAQESLANVRKHAYARSVTVELKAVGNTLRMIISDDGRGFDVDAVFQQRQDGEKLGLRSMRQRVQALQGDLIISSAPGQGTVLEFWCPMPASNRGNVPPTREEVAV